MVIGDHQLSLVGIDQITEIHSPIHTFAHSSILTFIRQHPGIATAS